MTEYLMVFRSRDDAEEVAEELVEDDFSSVRVVPEAQAGEDGGDTGDAEQDVDWLVHVVQDTVTDPSSAVGKGLTTRFEAMRRAGRSGPVAPGLPERGG